MFASSDHLANAAKDGKFDIEAFVVPSICTACDLQTVKHSTGAETHALTEAEMHSIGCPSPKSRIAYASGDPKRISICNIGHDQGSDNLGMSKRLRTATANIKHVFLVVQRCDAWEHAEHHPVRHFNGVATLVNIWRNSGLGETVRTSSEFMNGATAANFVVKGYWQGLARAMGQYRLD